MLKFKIVRPSDHRLVVKLRGDFSNPKIIGPKQKISEAIKLLPKGATVAFVNRTPSPVIQKGEGLLTNSNSSDIL